MKRDCDGYRLVDDIDMLVQPLTRLHAVISDYLEEQEKVSLEVRENLLDFYFKLSHFLDIYERQDENYVKYTRLCEDGSFELKLFCVNPRENLKECMLRGRSTILFPLPSCPSSITRTCWAVRRRITRCMPTRCLIPRSVPY